MLSVVKKTFFILFLFFFLSSLALATLVYMSVQEQPLVQQQNAINPQTAQKAKSLSKKLLRAAKTGNQGTALVIEKEELQGLADLARRAFSGVRAQVGLDSLGAHAAISLPLPKKYYQGYVNASVVLLPSNQGLVLGDVNIGYLSLNGAWVLSIAEWTANRLLAGDTGTQLIDAVKRVSTSNEQLEVAFKLPQDFDPKASQSDSFAMLRDKLFGIGYRDLIGEYYQVVQAYKPSAKQVSLTEYLNVAFSHARERTQNYDVEVIQENQAAILALATYFGSYRLRMMMGSNELTDGHSKRNSAKATLGDRVDLQQHFIYSAAIEVFSSQGISDLIGEVKELLDTSEGGTGFSFADLQADKAGVKFAQLATANDLSALKVQKLLANTNSEQDIFPAVTNLPEGIKINDFDLSYQNVESSQYQLILDEISSRLAQVPLYQIR